MEKKKVLITGGAGFLGINLVRYLLDKDYSVVSLDIAEFDYPEKDHEDVTIVTGDIRNRDDLDKAMKEVDVVVHTAAALPLYKPEDIFSTDVDGTRNVLQLAKDHGIKRVIHISSTAVYGVPDHHPIYEDDDRVGVGPYGEAKVRAEDICFEFRGQGLVVPVIRPKSFIGKERLGVFALLYDWAKDGKNFPILGNGNNKYQLMDVEDLCDAIFLTMTLEDEVVNDTFNIGAKVFTTMREDFQAVLDRAGFGKKIVGFPAGPVIWVLKILEALKLSPLYAWVYATAATDSFVSIEKAERLLGYKPNYSNKDALVRNYEWYIDNLKNFENTSGVSHRVPWKQGALKILKVFF